MPPLLPETVGLPLAFSLGLLYGLGPCLASCLPSLGPVFLNVDGGVRQAWRVLLPVSLGRLTVYAGFGAVSGWWGSRFVAGVEAWVAHLVLGLALLLIGLAVATRRFGQGGCGRRNVLSPDGSLGPGRPRPWMNGTIAQPTPRTPLLPSGLYLMGLGMALTPCAPLSVILIAAAATASPFRGGLLGCSFGVGAMLVPTLLYGVAVAYFGQGLRVQLGSWKPRLEAASAALFLLAGARQLAQLW